VSKTFSPALNRMAAWLIVAAGIAILAAGIRLGTPSDPYWWLNSLIFVPWELGPVLLAGLCAQASRTAAGQWLFLLMTIAFILFGADVYRDVMTSTNSTAPVALALYPFILYGVFLVVATVAALCGWRTRPDFPRRDPS
jgi:hypothetical protein